MDQQKMDVDGPIHVTAADGYRLQTRNVTVDLNDHSLSGRQGVEGQMPLGHFTAGSMAASMRDRHVTLTGRAHLHIDQGGLKRLK
jgi:lipopolysaccharide export system protein LptC